MVNINLPLNRLVEKYSDNIKSIAHVGAHLGQEVDIYLKIKKTSIHLFEPQYDVWNQLQEKVKNYNNIFAYNLALGSSSGEEKLYKASSNDGASSSILKPELHTKVQPNIHFENMEVINVKRFDELNIHGVNFLTIDVQGFELEVIKGFGDFLSEVDFIFTEINKDFLYEKNVLVKDLDIFLEIEGFIRVNTFWDPYLSYGDAFYIRSSMVKKYKKKFLYAKKKYQDSFINKFFLKVSHPKKMYFKLKNLLN